MVQDGVHVSRTNAIYPNPKTRPLGRKQFFELHQGAFKNIVSHLWLRKVGAVCRD